MNNNALDSLMLSKWQTNIPSPQEMTSALLGIITDVELPNIDTSKNLFVILKQSPDKNPSLTASLQYSTPKEQVSIPIELQSNFDNIKLNPDQQIKIEAKIKENSQNKIELQILNIKLPEEKKTDNINTQNNIIIKDLKTSIKQIQTLPLKIELPNIKQPQQIKLDIVNINTTPISTQQKGPAIKVPNIQSIADLKEFIENIKAQPIMGTIEKKAITKEDIKTNIPTEVSPNSKNSNQTNQQIPDTQIKKQTTFTQQAPQKEVTFIKTDLGNVFFQEPINIPKNTKIELQIKELILDQNSITTHSKTDFQQRLLSTLDPIKKENPELFNKIINHIPNPQSPKFFKDLINITQANITKKTNEFFNTETTKEISNSSPNIKEAISKFSEVLIGDHDQSTIKANNQFRVIEIPIYNQQNLSNIKLAIKNNKNDETNTAPTKKKATRFVLETSFTNLGDFQFDGFAIKEEKRFDLIIRTQNKMKSDFISNVTSLFNKSLTDLSYAGTISINNQKFINVFEAKEDKKEGIFI